jgi:hypothetical protein
MRRLGFLVWASVLGLASSAVAYAQVRHRFHPPSPEALAACEGAVVGTACSFHLGEIEVTGTCRGPEGMPPACRPQWNPPPPEALQACQGLAAGAACSFSQGNEVIQGTCRQHRENRPPICRPAEPPSGASRK